MSDEQSRKKAVEAQNELENYAYSLKSTLRDDKICSAVSEEEKKSITTDVDEVISWMETNQLAKVDEFERKKKDLEEKVAPILCKISSQEEIRSILSSPLYVGYVRLWAPTYDAYVSVHQFVSTSLPEATEKGKKILYNEVNSSFRGGVKACTDLEFEEEKVEEYCYSDFWEGEHGQRCSPGGPALLVIKEITSWEGKFSQGKTVFVLPDGVETEEEDSEEDDYEDE